MTTQAQVLRWCQSLQPHVAAQLDGNNGEGYTCIDCQLTCKFLDRFMVSLCSHYHVGDCEVRKQMMRMMSYVRANGRKNGRSMQWLLQNRHMLPEEMP